MISRSSRGNVMKFVGVSGAATGVAVPPKVTAEPDAIVSVLEDLMG